MDEPIAYPFGPEVALDVDLRYRELQRRGPIRVQLASGDPCWLATSYDDVRTAHGDRRFGKELGIGRILPRSHPTPPLDPAQLANMDPPRHTRIRKLATQAFAKPRVRDLRDWVDALIDEILGEMLDHGPGVDFVATMAWNLPNRVVTGILGIPRADIPAFRGWIELLLDPRPENTARPAALHDLRGYLLELVAERRRRSTDDLLSELVQARDDDDRLTEDELVMLTMSLFLGGFETTAAQLGSTMFVLLSERHLWEELLAERALLPGAMEELWRWIPSARYGAPLPRWASEDVELSGVVIPRGDAVIPERSAANRDEAVFPNGWAIDFHRSDPAPHLSLGWGVHHCVGAHLAHLEIELTLEKLLDRLPGLELAVAPDDVVWSRRSMLRAVEALPIGW